MAVVVIDFRVMVIQLLLSEFNVVLTSVWCCRDWWLGAAGRSIKLSHSSFAGCEPPLSAGSTEV